MTIKIIDTNSKLVEVCKEVGLDAICGDYFRESINIPRHVLCTASNPQWTFGGGIDALFYDKFNGYCVHKQVKGGRMERIGNIIFAITVGMDYKATKEQVQKAIQFAIDNTADNETLCLSGLGTGIGGLSIKDFVDIMKSVK